MEIGGISVAGNRNQLTEVIEIMMDFKEILKEFEEEKVELYKEENQKEQKLLNDIRKNSSSKA